MDNSNKFLNRINSQISTLSEQYNFINKSLSEPEFMFNNAAKLGSTDTVIFKIMNVYEDNERKMNVHEFQAFLCSIVNEYFKRTFNDNLIEVRVRNVNSFPSVYAVYFDGSEVIQFNIFEKFYGTRDIKTEKEISLLYRDKEIEDDERIVKLQAEIYDKKQAKENIIRYIFNFHKKKNKSVINKLYYGITDFVYIFLNKKKLYENIDKVINKKIVEIEQIREEYKNFIRNLDKDIEWVNKKSNIINLIEPLFINSGYRKETEKYKLY